jgi:hypothetical protein
MSLPPSEIPQGAIRFNTDSQKLEFYAQGEWWNMVTDNVGIATGGDTTAGARGMTGGGASPGYTQDIEYINIASTGNAIVFGNLTDPRQYPGGCASNTRGLWGGGLEPGTVFVTQIDYATIASTGSVASFGDLFQARHFIGGCSNQTRGLFGGGQHPAYDDEIDAVTIASLGTREDFGILTIAREGITACASPTRGIWLGGQPVTNRFCYYCNFGKCSNFW